ncbi:hypothetical protein [Moraxella oblonga]|uniref:hypothetical protein n=1 Tax=Moraxella oblonga TaxID=200413 RepID=UPI00082FDC98|nr:hypothetical protein [Moraxella oblonga]
MNTQSTPINDHAFANLLNSWQNNLNTLKHNYATATNNLTDEFLITVSEQQINDALAQFVVKNVGLLLDLKLQLSDNSMRLYCTANFLGLYLSVYADFRLVQIRADKYIQQVVFEQISDTQIVDLYAKKWYKSFAIKHAIKLYRTLLKKDPLPFLLSLSPKLKGKPFIEYKGNFIYLEIGRWFPESIKNKIKKIQITHAQTLPEQLLIKAQPNFGEILSFGDPNANIITEKDNPNKT